MATKKRTHSIHSEKRKRSFTKLPDNVFLLSHGDRSSALATVVKRARNGWGLAGKKQKLTVHDAKKKKVAFKIAAVRTGNGLVLIPRDKRKVLSPVAGGRFSTEDITRVVRSLRTRA